MKFRRIMDTIAEYSCIVLEADQRRRREELGPQNIKNF